MDDRPFKAKDAKVDEPNSQPGRPDLTKRRCPTCGLIVPVDTRTCPNDSTVLTTVQKSSDAVPNYRFIRVLGSGGMGHVYEAEHVVLKNRVAIKLLRAHLIDTDALMRFQQEAKTTSRLKHPNVISVYDCGVSEEGEPYMVMDLIHGETLDVVLKRGPLSIEESLIIFRQVCLGVICAHENGILHRDLKPSNIMLEKSATRNARVLDFGIAKIIEGEDAMMRTRTGEIFGSPPYMSPEQAEGKKLDQRADLYSLTCVLYEMLTGLPPFIGSSAVDVLFKHVNEKPLSLTEATLGRKFPVLLENLVARGLAKDPGGRFPSVKEMLAALDSYNVRNQVSSAPQAKRPSVVILGIASAVILGLLGSGIYLLQAHRDAPPVKPPVTTEKDSATAIVAAAAGDAKAGVVEQQILDDEDDKEFGQMLTAKPPEIIRIDHIPIGIHDQSLAALKPFKMLENVDLTGCRNITGVGLYNLVGLNIQFLNLSNTKVGGEAVGTLNLMNKLKNLSLASTPINDDDLQRLFIPSLTNLDLRKTSIAAKGLTNFGRFQNIDCLGLDDCPNINDKAMQHLSGMKSLTLLSMNGTKLSDNIIEFLVKSPALRTLLLNFDPSPNLTGKVLRDIIQRKAAPNLTQLELSDCSHISEDDIAYFKKMRPQCRVVTYRHRSAEKEFYNLGKKRGADIGKLLSEP